MNIHDVSTYLLRFDEAPRLAPQSSLPAPLPAPLSPSSPILDTLFESSMELPDEDFAPDIVAREAHDDAAPLRRAFDEELAAALEKQQAAHEEDLRLLRTQWIEEQGELLARRLSESLAEALEALRTDVARILAPFVAREVEQTTSQELIDAIRRAVAGENGPAIRLQGPRELIEKMAEALVEQQAAVSLTETDGVDVTVDFDMTRIETRLDAWMRRLRDSRSEGL